MSRYKLLNFKGTFILEHRLVVEKHLGRPLSRTEHVHHINGNPKDNRIENLELLTKSNHHKRHWEEDSFKIICSMKCHKKKCIFCNNIFYGNWRRQICFSDKCRKQRNRNKAHKWYHLNINIARKQVLQSYYRHRERRKVYMKKYGILYRKKRHLRKVCSLAPSS